jgi:hypothetical protein
MDWQITMDGWGMVLAILLPFAVILFAMTVVWLVFVLFEWISTAPESDTDASTTEIDPELKKQREIEERLRLEERYFQDRGLF